MDSVSQSSTSLWNPESLCGESLTLKWIPGSTMLSFVLNGRTISVEQRSLQRAKIILGLVELGDFVDDEVHEDINDNELNHLRKKIASMEEEIDKMKLRIQEMEKMMRIMQQQQIEEIAKIKEHMHESEEYTLMMQQQMDGMEQKMMFIV